MLINQIVEIMPDSIQHFSFLKGMRGVVTKDLGEDFWEVRFTNGYLVNIGQDEFTIVTPTLFVSVYIKDRAYGGPEEGGWWYDTMSPVYDMCQQAFSVEDAEAKLKEVWIWCEEENAKRNSDINSVNSDGTYMAFLECNPPEPSPLCKPPYE